MRKIEEIDKNLKIETKIQKEDILFYDVKSDPIKISGIFYENGKFRRMPEDVAKNVNHGVLELHAATAGGRARFKTNSKYVAINVKFDYASIMPHFAASGSAGFDLYTKKDGKETYVGTFTPPYNVKDGYESVIEFTDEEEKDIIINFPLYSTISEVYIGISNKATLLPPCAYEFEKPVLYYGSSITQGGCASRPGNSYQAVISRRLNCDYINLGFSGSAKGEETIAKYIADIDMSVFVYDYDHNASTAEFLRQTHKPMFDIIREKNPELPIIIVTKPERLIISDESPEKRIEVIRETYDKAIAAGDKNVYFINGQDMFNLLDSDMMTVDGCHPNDFGFYCMATVIGKVVEKILKK